jgi:hypothetical protein
LGFFAPRYGLHIARAFAGIIFTNEYRRIERAYIESALAFIKEGGLTSVRVEGLENPKGLRSALVRARYSRSSMRGNEDVHDSIRPLLQLSREMISRSQKLDYALTSSLERDPPSREAEAEQYLVFLWVFPIFGRAPLRCENPLDVARNQMCLMRGDRRMRYAHFLTRRFCEQR